MENEKMTTELSRKTGNNPFRESTDLSVKNQASTSLEVAESSRQMAEVQASMAIAKRFPRNNIDAMDRILQACQRPSLAEQAIYTYPRGGQQVTGPTIKLAEAIAQNWGNINFGIRELGQHNNKSTILAYAWDLETNTRSEKVFEVSHVRHTKKGNYKLEDPRDIYEMVANQGARRLRNCILSIIPGDVIDAALREVEETQFKNMGAPEEQIKKMLEAFLKYKIVKKHIEDRLKHPLKSITNSELVSLRNIFNSIRDGYSKPEDWFNMEL